MLVTNFYSALPVRRVYLGESSLELPGMSGAKRTTVQFSTGR